MFNNFYDGHLKSLSVNGNEIKSHCPFHNDGKPSFSVNVETGQFFCHACGEKGNAFTFAQKLNIPLEQVPGYDPNYKSNKPKPAPKLIKTYDYVDENGKLLFQVCRYEPKDFRQRRPDGNGGWQFHLNGVRRVPYRLPEIRQADQVIIVEGEKDVDNLFAAGFCATTNPGGANKWNPDYNDWLRDKQVILIPDNDPPGIRHMQDIADSLQGIARSVKLIQLPPSLGEKADVSDFLNKMGPEKLRQLIDSPMPELELQAMEMSHQEINNFNMTDNGNALLLCKCYGDKVRYLRDMNTWLIWNGHLWHPDVLGKVNRLPVQVASKRYEAIQVVQDKKRIEDIGRFVNRCESAGKIASCLSLAQTMPPIVSLSTDYDKDPYLFGCANGVLDLQTRRLLNGSKRQPVSMATNVVFDPQAGCPRWDRFLEEIFDNDNEMINFINLAVGYSITGDISEECLFMLYGKGANGKSTFLKVLSHVIGDYADTTPFTTFLSSSNDAGRIPNDVADLYKKRFVVASEIKENSRINEERIKALTGGDKVKARKLYMDHFKFEPTFKFWLAVNHKPKITDSSDGLWRRIRLVPFEQCFSGDWRNNQLESKLLAEASGILNWIVSGCLAWQKYGLKVPDKVNAMTQEYRQESNVIEQFLEEMTFKGQDKKVKASSLFSAWKEWAEKRNENPLTQTRFGNRLSAMGYTKEKNGCNYYLGIGLEDEQHG